MKLFFHPTAIVTVAACTSNLQDFQSRHTGLPGSEYLQELFNSNHEQCIYDVLRMKRQTFFELRDWYLINTNLKSSRISIEEKLVIFLFRCTTGARYIVVCERFQHSKDTISRVFHEVLIALLQLVKHNIILPQSKISDHSILCQYKYQYFTGCLGALDGTHIPISVNSNEAPAYRNRKGYLSQNVLMVCDFDMKFRYILIGWEGSAHDAAVLKDAILTAKFKTPIEYYWLGDAGYVNTDFLLVPYRGVKYHLKEFGKSKERPKNYKELFNLRHAVLRNVIERIFGILKCKFLILGDAQFSTDTQVRLPHALTALHNFVRDKEGIYADEFLDRSVIDNQENQLLSQNHQDISEISNNNERFEERDENSITSIAMNKKRDEIAIAIWNDYITYLQIHGLDSDNEIETM